MNGRIVSPTLNCMATPVGFLAVVVSLIGVGFWFGMIKRSFKVKTTV